MPDLDAWTDPHLSEFLDEQIQATKKVREVGTKMPPIGSIPAEKIRAGRLYNKDGSLKPALVDWATDVHVDVNDRTILTRQFAPEHSKGLYIHFHGGGWALGSVYEQDELLANCALATARTVITIDYPLTPSNTLATIIETAFQTILALMDTHSDSRVCIGGESAGAHVAASCILRLKDHPEKLARVDASNLSYGLFDLSMTPSQRNWGDAFLALSTPALKWFQDMAMPGLSAEERRSPALSPLFADLSGLPPAIFSVGALDPLLDDTLFMAMRWRAAGNQTVLKIYPEATHGFNGLPTAMGRACNDAINAFLAAPHLQAESEVSALSRT